MHSKKKGNTGQFGVSLALSKLGYSVFTEEGDISKIDVIAEGDGKLIRIQCKAITPKNGFIPINLKKSGPNYKFKYQTNMFDYFGIYDLEDSNVYLVSSRILESHGHSFSLRKVKTKNNQREGVNYASDFLIDKVLTFSKNNCTL